MDPQYTSIYWNATMYVRVCIYIIYVYIKTPQLPLSPNGMYGISPSKHCPLGSRAKWLLHSIPLSDVQYHCRHLNLCAGRNGRGWSGRGKGKGRCSREALRWPNFRLSMLFYTLILYYIFIFKTDGMDINLQFYMIHDLF